MRATPRVGGGAMSDLQVGLLAIGLMLARDLLRHARRHRADRDLVRRRVAAEVARDRVALRRRGGQRRDPRLPVRRRAAVRADGHVRQRLGHGRDTFDVFQWLLRRVRGGLGLATVGANAVFAAITGISIASASVFTRSRCRR